MNDLKKAVVRRVEQRFGASFLGYEQKSEAEKQLDILEGFINELDNCISSIGNNAGDKLSTNTESNRQQPNLDIDRGQDYEIWGRCEPRLIKIQTS